MSENQELTGKVVWFCNKRGFGFIKPDEGDKDIFCHYSNVESDGFRTLKPDQRVTFNMGTNHRGEQAINVKVIDSESKE